MSKITAPFIVCLKKYNLYNFPCETGTMGMSPKWKTLFTWGTFYWLLFSKCFYRSEPGCKPDSEDHGFKNDQWAAGVACQYQPITTRPFQPFRMSCVFFPPLISIMYQSGKLGRDFFYTSGAFHCVWRGWCKYSFLLCLLSPVPVPLVKPFLYLWRLGLASLLLLWAQELDSGNAWAIIEGARNGYF